MATQTLKKLMQVPLYSDFLVQLKLDFKRAKSMGEEHTKSMRATDIVYKDRTPTEKHKMIATVATGTTKTQAKAKAVKMASIFSSKNFGYPSSQTLERILDGTQLKLSFKISTSKPTIALKVVAHIFSKMQQLLANEIIATDFYNEDATMAWTIHTNDKEYVYGFWVIDPKSSTIEDLTW